jgi:hypothetical protein
MSQTALDSSVTLDEVFAVVATKRVPLAPELAGYLALELAEHADPAGGDVDPKSVYVGDEGTVALVKLRRDGACGSAEASIRAALARLLDASGSQTPALAAASRRKSGSGLPALAEELEAALIPVNRAAARRALARLAREVKRVTLGVGRAALPSTSDASPSSRRASSPSYTPGPPRIAAPAAEHFPGEEDPTTTRAAVPEDVLNPATPGQPSTDALPTRPRTVGFESAGPSPSQADIDALIENFGVSSGTDAPQTRDLKTRVGLDPTPPPARHARRAHPANTPTLSEDSDVESLLAMGGRDFDRTPQPARRLRGGKDDLPERGRNLDGTSPAAPERGRNLDDRQLPTQPSRLRQRQSLPSVPHAKPPRGSPVVVGLAMVAVAVGVLAVWQLRPGSRTGHGAERSGPNAAASSPAPSACKGTLVVTDVPAHAEVLLREGQAPVDVERMPVGTRLEFVATAEGFAPKRVVVPAGASWDTAADGKPRLEVGVQLDKSRAHPGANDPWPASDPGSTVGGKGPPGMVHVVATPRGAEVWLLAGIGPEARVEQLSCNQDVDVLLAGPTTYRKRLHVSGADFAPDDAGPSVARVSAR